MCETNYRMEFRSKDKLTEKALENFIKFVGFASRHHGIEIEIVDIKERSIDPFAGRIVSEAP